MKTAIYTVLTLTLAAGSVFADTLALVAADSLTNETAAQQAFVNTGKFTNVAVFDAQTSTPALATLQQFTHVLAWTVAAPHDPVALGDLLASFYDTPGGGKHLTVATYAFSTVPSVAPFFLPNPALQGKVTTVPYAGFVNTNLIGDLSGSLVPSVPNDPVWAGIDPTQVFYSENQYSAHPQLATGATLIAADGSGPSAIGLIARSQNGIINVNFYPGGPQGTTMGNNNPALFALLTNTFLAGQTAPDTTPPTSSATVQPAPNAKGWDNSNVTVSITAIDNPGGTGVKQISVTLSGAQNGATVVPGNSAPISITTEGTTNISYFATDNSGNVETAKILTVLLDKTPPSVTATPNPLPNASGINTTAPVTVTFTGTDTLSGLASCTPAVTLTATGTATGSCTDIAGNTATVSKTITIVDPPPPPPDPPSGPVISGVPAAGSCVLHHANNKLVRVATLSVDPSQATSFNVTGASNEVPDKDKSDIVIKGAGLQPRVIDVRAEHGSKGTDRIYTLTATASGKSGQTTVTFTCTVVHNAGDNDDPDQDGQH